MKPNFILMFLFFIISGTLQAQENTWELKSQNEDMTVYFRESMTSDLKELKINMKVKGQLSSIMAWLHDIDNFTNWVYKCSGTKPLKVVSKNEMYYYSTMDFPWPLSDRDFIAHSLTVQDPVTRVVTSTTIGLKDYLPEKEEMVRLPFMEIVWILKPINKDEVEIDYLLKSDPGGNLPIWLVNMAVDHGPSQTMMKLKELVQEAAYKNKRLAHIID